MPHCRHTANEGTRYLAKRLQGGATRAWPPKCIIRSGPQSAPGKKKKKVQGKKIRERASTRCCYNRRKPLPLSIRGPNLRGGGRRRSQGRETEGPHSTQELPKNLTTKKLRTTYHQPASQGSGQQVQCGGWGRAKKKPGHRPKVGALRRWWGPTLSSQLNTGPGWEGIQGDGGGKKKQNTRD